jgi:RecJ-like exonuclease
MQALESVIENIVDFIEEDFSPVFIASHYNADGLASAIILAKIFYQKRIPFVLRLINSHYDIEEIYDYPYNRIIIADMSFDSTIKKIAKKKKLVLIDHHQFDSNLDYSDLIFLNPYLFNYDGNNDASSSTLCYLIAKQIDEFNIDLSIVALAGSIGDKQDVAENRFFKGINLDVYNEAEEAGLISKQLGIISYSNLNDNLINTFSLTFEPFIFEIFNNVDATRDFLKKCEVDEKFFNIKLSEINEKDQIEICKKVAKKLLKEGYFHYYVGRLFGFNYRIFYNKINNLRQLSLILDLSGRYNYHMEIIKNFLVNRIDLTKLFNNYLNIIKNNLENIIKRKKDKEYKNFFYIDLNISNERIVGNILDLLISSNISNKDIFVGSSRSKHGIKLSFRLRNKEKEINLGEKVREVAKKFNGIGGGHKEAAGAIIATEYLDDFLSTFDSVL